MPSQSQKSPTENSTPSWPRATSTYANQVADRFKADLRAIAETFARHEKQDSLSRKHVDEAFLALARLGLHSKTFWQRSDTWTGLGTFLVGIAFSVPDGVAAVGGFAEISENSQKTLSLLGAVSLGIVGAIIAFWARYRGSLPSKRGAV